LVSTQRILNNVKIPLFKDDTKRAISDITKNIADGLKTNKNSGKEEFMLEKIILYFIKRR